jgi:hypothetical protein
MVEPKDSDQITKGKIDKAISLLKEQKPIHNESLYQIEKLLEK